MHKNLAKIKQSHPFEQVQASPRATKISLTAMFGKMKVAISEKAIASYSRFESKLNETPGVFIVPQQGRRVIDASLHKQEKKPSANSTNKVEREEKPRAGSHLNDTEALRLKQLLSKRQDLMDRLKKIDQSLQNHNPTPITFEGAESGATQDYGRFSRLKSIQSRINLKNSQTYNLVQHEKNVEMLSRLNLQKIRRQQKMVLDLKRKQQNEVRKMEEIEKNKSQLQLSRQLRPINALKQAPKATFSEKLQSLDPYEHLPVTNRGAIQNEFDSLSQIPIARNDPSFHTEQVEAELSQNV